MKDKGISFRSSAGDIDFEASVDDGLLHTSFSLKVPDDYEGEFPSLDVCVSEEDIPEFVDALRAMASYASVFCGEGKAQWSPEKMVLVIIEQEDGEDLRIPAILVDYCVVLGKDGERSIGLRVTEPTGFHHIYAPGRIKKIRPLLRKEGGEKDA